MEDRDHLEVFGFIHSGLEIVIGGLWEVLLYSGFKLELVLASTVFPSRRGTITSIP